jgi:hypothetical protein
MKRTDKKASATTRRHNASPSLLEGFRKLLVEIHPRLPAYFYGGNGILAPLPVDKEGEAKMAELGLTRLVPDGHIDMDVLLALHEAFACDYDGLWWPYFPQRAVQILRKSLANKNSKISQTLAKAYGEE